MGRTAKSRPCNQQSGKQTQPTHRPHHPASCSWPYRTPSTAAWGCSRVCACIYACLAGCRDHRRRCCSCCSPALRIWRCGRQGCSEGAGYSQRRQCSPCPKQFTASPTLQHLTREKEARRKTLNPSTFPCTVGRSSDTSSSLLDGETRPPGSTHGRRAAPSTPSSDRLLSCLCPRDAWHPGIPVSMAEIKL